MRVNQEEKKKMFLDIVEHLQHMVQELELQPGDRLPSERVLTDRLQVGRSSVREALRALELLGVIETKRGEGTFLSDPTKHRLVELLAAFLLRNPTTRQEVSEVKCLLESAQHTYDPISTPHMITSDDELDKMDKKMQSVDNRLLYRIWKLLAEYETAAKKANHK